MICRKIGFLMAFVLLSLMFCPYMEAVTQSKAESNCHGQPTSPVNPTLHSCCDNDAILVQQFHIAPTSRLLHTFVLEEKATLIAIHSPNCDSPRLYQTTADELAALSVLRL
jgi:hypothetical protein